MEWIKVEDILSKYPSDISGHYSKENVIAAMEEFLNQNRWIKVENGLPEILETVWISNGKGWTTLGCRSDYFNGDNEDLIWSWCETNGVIYEEDGKIVSECEADDLDVKFWMPLPNPPKQ